MTSALARATVLALGRAHVAPDGTLIIEDAGVAARLERDECDLLGGVLLGIAHGDVDEVLASASMLGEQPPPELARAVRSGLACLAVEWTPVAFGLTLRRIGRAATPQSGCALLQLLASEVLQRLDLAHEHPHGLTVLQSPGHLVDLVESARTTPSPWAASRRRRDAPPMPPTHGLLRCQHDRQTGR